MMQETDNKRNTILNMLEGIDFEGLTPDDDNDKKPCVLAIKVDKNVHDLFTLISKRRGQTMKALGYKCILDFLKKYKEEI